MFKKVLVMLIVFTLGTTSVFAQYEDDAPLKTADTGGFTGNESIFKDKITKGTEFMVIGNQGIYLELAPIVAYTFNDYLMAGVGVNGSFLGFSGSKYLYYGGRAFGRATYRQYFLQAEYNFLNGDVPGSAVSRIWVTSPVVSLGMMMGDNAWISFGYATNTEFQQINPLGGLIYHFGFFF